MQPDSAVRAPMEMWGPLGSNDPKADRAWLWSHELADGWRTGKANRNDVINHYKNFFSDFDLKLGNNHSGCIDFLGKFLSP